MAQATSVRTDRFQVQGSGHIGSHGLVSSSGLRPDRFARFCFKFRGHRAHRFARIGFKFKAEATSVRTIGLQVQGSGPIGSHGSVTSSRFRPHRFTRFGYKFKVEAAWVRTVRFQVQG